MIQFQQIQQHNQNEQQWSTIPKEMIAKVGFAMYMLSVYSLNGPCLRGNVDYTVKCADIFFVKLHLTNG